MLPIAFYHTPLHKSDAMDRNPFFFQDTVLPDSGELSSIDAEPPSDEAL